MTTRAVMLLAMLSTVALGLALLRPPQTLYELIVLLGAVAVGIAIICSIPTQ